MRFVRPVLIIAGIIAMFYGIAVAALYDEQRSMLFAGAGNRCPAEMPAGYRVVRIATVDGERIIDAEMVMGYLHRSMEKLAEERTYTQNIPFTDPTDYLSSLSNNLGYFLTVEQPAGIDAPDRGPAPHPLIA